MSVDLIEELKRRLGISCDLIYETIVTTLNKDNSPHIAPLGAIFKETGEIILRPFRKTISYKNLASRGRCTINITLDATIFFLTTFKKLADSKPSVMIEDGWIHLRDASACIDAEVLKIEFEDDRALVYCKPLRLTINHEKCIRPFTRADTALMESTIHATRVPLFLKEGRYEEAIRLVQLIEHYVNLVNRVAPNSQYSRYCSKILEYANDLIKRFKDG